MKNRNRLAIYSAWCALLPLIAISTGCRNRANNEVPGLFETDEPWLILWGSSKIGGYGAIVEFAVIEEGEGPVCMGVASDGKVSYGGRRLDLRVTIVDSLPSRQCSLELDAVADHCAETQSCLLGDEMGAIVVDGVNYPEGPAFLVRSPDCGPLPTSLQTARSWFISNLHFLSESVSFNPTTVGPYVRIGRSAAEETEGVVIDGVSDQGVNGCVDPAVEGEILFDGAAFALDLNMSDAGNGNTCSVAFQGDRTYCFVVPNGIVLRFEGSGQWTRDGESTPMKVLFLTLAPE